MFFPCEESWDGSDTIGIFFSLIVFRDLRSKDSMEHKFISQTVTTRHGRVSRIQTPWMTCRNQGDVGSAGAAPLEFPAPESGIHPRQGTQQHLHTDALGCPAGKAHAKKPGF